MKPNWSASEKTAWAPQPDPAPMAKTDPINRPDYRTAGEIAMIFKCSSRKIRRLVEDGALVGFRCGRQILIPWHSVRAYIKTEQLRMQGALIEDDD